MRAGRFVKQVEGYSAFIPAPLPPDPPVTTDPELARLLSDADRALGRLDGVGRRIGSDGRNAAKRLLRNVQTSRGTRKHSPNPFLESFMPLRGTRDDENGARLLDSARVSWRTGPSSGRRPTHNGAYEPALESGRILHQLVGSPDGCTTILPKLGGAARFLLQLGIGVVSCRTLRVGSILKQFAARHSVRRSTPCWRRTSGHRTN